MSWEYLCTLVQHQKIPKWSSQCRYLGVLIDCYLRWGAHCHNIVQKGSRVLNLLRQSLFGCTKNVKSLAYRSLVRPCNSMEYASVVWSPHTTSDINLLEADCLHELNWPTLTYHHHYYIIDYIHSMVHKRNSVISVKFVCH